MSLFDFARAEAVRQGVDPDLVSRAMQQESGGDPNATSPKGAHGPMQLMPGTARDMGVDPSDPQDNIRGGVKYLKQQLDRFKSPELALAAYNAGPGAVIKAGGVPNFAETKGYVRSIMGSGQPQSGADIFGGAPAGPSASQGGSGADIFADAPAPAAISAPAAAAHAGGPQELAASHNRGVTIDVEPPTPPTTSAPTPAAGPTIAQDALSGFMAPLNKVWDDLGTNYKQVTARGAAGPPKSLGEAGKQMLDELSSGVHGIGDVLNLASAPTNAITRPLARAIGKLPMTPYAAPQLSWANGRPQLSAPRALTGDEAQANVEDSLNMALSAARPESPVPLAAPKVKAPSVADLQTAKTAAYQAADQAGVRYSPQAFGKLAQDITSQVAGAHFNPALHPNAAAMLDYIHNLAGQAAGHAPSLTDLDQLRQVIGRDVSSSAAPGEQAMGARMTGRIDDFIDNATPSDLLSGSPTDAADLIRNARDLNTRWRKAKEVTDRTDSADLRASSTYAGGNQANATRQNLRPLIDPKSPQRMKNLTPDETKALNGVVRGTPAQNAMRVAGKVMDPRGLIGTTFSTMFGLGTHGVGPAVSAPIGMAASSASNRMTAGAVQKLIDLMATGGAKPAPAAPVYPTLALGGRPAIPLFSPRGLVGGSSTAQLLARVEEALQGRGKTR